MFVPYTFASVNSPDQLRRGVYRAEAEFYAGGDAQPKLTLIHYTHQHEPEASVVDLVSIEPDGSVRVCD